MRILLRIPLKNNINFIRYRFVCLTPYMLIVSPFIIEILFLNIKYFVFYLHWYSSTTYISLLVVYNILVEDFHLVMILI